MTTIQQLYQTKELWKQENCAKPIESWDAPKLQWFQNHLLRICTSAQEQKYGSILRKIQRVMDEEEIGGDILIAGGKQYLIEKAREVITNRSDRARLDHAIAIVFAAVQAEQTCGNLSYWERMATESEIGEALHSEYSSNTIGALLQASLVPRSLEMIEYSSLSQLEAANSIMDADDYVSKSVEQVADKRMFKVVTVAPRDTPTIAWSNLIYVRSDIAAMPSSRSLEQQQQDYQPIIAMSRRLKRINKHKRFDPPARWILISSVDFAQHGSAMPGHWHLNASISGDRREDLVPHLAVSLTDRPGRETWHGKEDGCPLWWSFIPKGMVYKTVPARIAALLANECSQS